MHGAILINTASNYCTILIEIILDVRPVIRNYRLRNYKQMKKNEYTILLIAKKMVWLYFIHMFFVLLAIAYLGNIINT